MEEMKTMNNYNAMVNNLETLGLTRIRENIDRYMDMVTEGSKTLVDALYELTEQELGYRMDTVIKGNVKVANFPYLKEIKDFDFSFQPSLDKAKIMDFMSLRFLERAENIIFCGGPGVGDKPGGIKA